jgi:hypothetical protein
MNYIVELCNELKINTPYYINKVLLDKCKCDDCYFYLLEHYHILFSHKKYIINTINTNNNNKLIAINKLIELINISLDFIDEVI